MTVPRTHAPLSRQRDSARVPPQYPQVAADASLLPSTPDLIRASGLTGYRELVTRLGGDPNRLLHQFHIPSAALDCEDALISLRSMIRLLEATAQALSCADFGMQLAREQDLKILGPLGIIGLNSRTVGDAVRSIIEYMDFYSPVLVCRIDTQRDREHVLMTWDVAITGEPHKRQTAELALCLFNRDMQILTDGHFVPVSVLFRHTTPLPQSVYRTHFGTRVQFGKSVNALVARRTDLERRIDKVDPHLRTIIAEYVRHTIAHHPLDTKSQVEYVTRRLLSDGRCSLRAVSRHLYLHERTLQRRLHLAGLHFQDILEAARRERAEELLSESGLSMAQIAAQLGYSKQSSFNRAYRRWFGTSPTRRTDRGRPTTRV